MSIRIFYDDIDYRLKGWRKVARIINEVIREYRFIPGDLSFILTSDYNIRKINSEFLKHDYFTDVITFGYNEENVIKGEIYISLETVESNAQNYNISLRNELLRVMAHGVIHLMGYDDGTEEERSKMREIENIWLKRLGEETENV